MLRTIFGKKENDEKPSTMASASSITDAEFKDTLSRYPALIQKFSDDENPTYPTLLQLDQYRYLDAPAAFSKQTGRTMVLEDVKKLVDWKLRHGKWRPSLSKLVASNSDENIATATMAAFTFYNKNPSDFAGTLKTLSEPLRGVGPATASLLLSVHDPKNVVFFSDEAYRWLVADGEKVKLLYNVKEYEELSEKTHSLMERLKVNPMDIERAAFVIIKESEPIREPAPKKVPSGRPRGRPALPDNEKKPKKPTVPGRGRGRPAKSGGEKGEAVAAKGTGRRGRPAKTNGDTPKPEVKAAEPSAAKAEKEADVTTPVKRGRKRQSNDEEPNSASRSSKRGKN